MHEVINVALFYLLCSPRPYCFAGRAADRSGIGLQGKYAEPGASRLRAGLYTWDRLGMWNIIDEIRLDAQLATSWQPFVSVPIFNLVPAFLRETDLSDQYGR